MKGISFYLVTYNEEKSIGKIIEKILKQTVKPDEIIIVDNNSKDNTLKIIKDYIKKGAPINLIVKKSNIAEARNIARKAARYDIIISTDAGCTIPKNWVEKLTKPLDKYDVTYGGYEAEKTSFFHECAAPFMFNSKAIKSGNFLASNRNLAYKKKVWEEIGLPENLDRGDDTYFMIMLKKKGYKMKFVPDTVVKWKPRDNLRQVLKFNYLDARSNLKSKEIMTYKPIFKKIILMYLFIVLYPASILIYLPMLWLIPIGFAAIFLKMLMQSRSLKKAWLMTLILTAKRSAQVLGTIRGTINLILNKK